MLSAACCSHISWFLGIWIQIHQALKTSCHRVNLPSKHNLENKRFVKISSTHAGCKRWKLTNLLSEHSTHGAPAWIQIGCVLPVKGLKGSDTLLERLLGRRSVIKKKKKRVEWQWGEKKPLTSIHRTNVYLTVKTVRPNYGRLKNKVGQGEKKASELTVLWRSESIEWWVSRCRGTHSLEPAWRT